MNQTSYFMAKLTDEAVWEHLQTLLRAYDPEMAEKHTAYISALESLTGSGADAEAFHRAIQSTTASDALFAFQKGMEANFYHFRHPFVPSFAGLDYEDMQQEYAMLRMPKRLVAQQEMDRIRSMFFCEDAPWCEAIREYIIDLEMLVPQIMHFEGYKAGNEWFKQTIPGYCEDSALTSIYYMQLCEYFGKHL